MGDRVDYEGLLTAMAMFEISSFLVIVLTSKWKIKRLIEACGKVCRRDTK